MNNASTIAAPMSRSLFLSMAAFPFLRRMSFDSQLPATLASF